MEAIKIFDNKKQPLDWDYDEEADTLYLSFGPPRPAIGLDAGDRDIVRFDEAAREIGGLTIVGVGHRLENYLKEK